MEELFAPLDPQLCLVDVPYRLYRDDTGSHRFYYCPDTDQYYGSITTIIQATTPTPYGLQQWMKKHGEASDFMRDERAAYGTALHVEAAALLETGECDLDTIADRVEEFLIPGASMERWVPELQKDLLSFEAFRRVHKVRPVAIELPLKSDEHGFAGTIDLVCDMVMGSGANGNFLKADKGGIPVRAIVDIKSGKKGFYESHEMQLTGCRRLWNENVDQDDRAARVFNWSPTDWRWPNPTFKLKEQTHKADSHEARLDHLIDLFRMDHAPKPSRHIRGVIRPDADLAELMTESSVRDWCAENMTVGETS